MKPREEINHLRSELHRANRAYYVDSDPVMTDAEFDEKLRRLVKLEADWPEYADPNSPTQRVGGAPVKGFAKVKHAQRMLSLDNTFSVEDTIKFLVSKGVGLDEEVRVEPKIDGLSFAGRWEASSFSLGITRGDGEVGDDVTVNARTIACLPLVLLESGLTVEVRGEVYMARATFDELNARLDEEGDKLFANPRNAAAGTMKNRDSGVVAKRKLAFLAYSLLAPNMELAPRDIPQYLADLGFPAAPGVFCKLRDIAGPIADLHARRLELPYDIDGAVVKLLDPKRQQQLGEGTKYVHWAVAHKYPAEKVATKMLSVTCQVGKTGVITPVAELKPVSLAGTTVSRASLMNADEVQRIGCAVGDTVFVLKSGEIIPRVVGVADSDDYRSYLRHHNRDDSPFGDTPVTSEEIVEFNRAASRVWNMPETCPSCGTMLVKARNADGKESVYTICPNSAECEEQVVQRLKHACCKAALDWDGMGIAQVRTLYSECGVRRLSDLFRVEQRGACGTKTYEQALSPAAHRKFLAERERVKEAPFWRKLHALGVEGIGASYSKDLEAAFPSILAIADADFSAVEKVVGEVNARTLFTYIADNADEIETLDLHGFALESTRVTGVLTGKTFVITGEMTSGTRAQVSDRIEKAGGTVKNTVSKKVDYLVIGDNSGNVKAAAAARHGTRRINEEELYAMLGIPMPVATALGAEYE